MEADHSEPAPKPIPDQPTPDQPPTDQPPTNPRAPFSDGSLEQIRSKQSQFAAERDWEQFHTPRNLVLALVGEVGELAEIFQWKGEVAPGLPGWSDADREHLGEEISDVLLYLIRLSDVCGVDLPAVCASKMAKNAAKYPASLVKGSSRKYTEYRGKVQLDRGSEETVAPAQAVNATDERTDIKRRRADADATP